MGFLLKRKSKVKTLTCNTPLKQTKAHASYVTNPYSKAGQQARNASNAPEQVQDVSESGKVENSAQDVQVIVSYRPVEPENIPTSNENMEEEENEKPVESIGNLQSEPECSNVFKVHLNACNAPIQSQASKETENPILDSDSNYSFSENFEMPSAVQTTAAVACVSVGEATVAVEPTGISESANAIECLIQASDSRSRSSRNAATARLYTLKCPQDYDDNDDLVDNDDDDDK